MFLLRAVAFFLALALVGAGFVSQEETPSYASASSEAACVVNIDAPVPGASDGWVDDHPMDGQPVQTQAETLADQPGLFLVGPGTHIPALAMTRPMPYASAALTPPYLDGPQRPPCLATTLVA